MGEREGVWKDHARQKQPVIAYACLYPKLAASARENGYALAMHGSLVADCDLIAVPWAHDACSHDALAFALSLAAGGHLILDQHEGRPAGIRKHIIHLGGGPYIDLAVVPLAARDAEIARLRDRIDPLVVRAEQWQRYLENFPWPDAPQNQAAITAFIREVAALAGSDPTQGETSGSAAWPTCDSPSTAMFPRRDVVHFKVCPYCTGQIRVCAPTLQTPEKT